MKKLKKIESSKMNFNEDHRLTPQEMSQVTGGAGCICYRNPFYVNDVCACNEKNFGLCNKVNGGGGNAGYPPSPGTNDSDSAAPDEN